MPAGLDPEHRTRAGNVFTHALVNPPDGFDARTALLGWRHRFWRVEDSDDFDLELPDVGPDDMAGRSEALDADLRSVLSAPSGRKLLRFVFTAFLVSAGEDSQIFVVAPAPEVALCRWGVARSLPARLRAGLTFSTHEPNPVNCSARLVGCWWAKLPIELPGTC